MLNRCFWSVIKCICIAQILKSDLLWGLLQLWSESVIFVDCLLVAIGTVERILKNISGVMVTGW